ncbi:hypothetical protein T484DRAFT_3160354 [Baffinella frigidus]|nr:hypothetical protein T484DRAFT_3160354 [Cryptophyta sp. CCMP2293]
MGIGDDFLPLSGIKVFWGCLLATCFRSSQTDLTRMEAVVEESGLDYLLVRPMGIDPSEKPTGSFQLIKKSGEGGLPMTVSKVPPALRRGPNRESGVLDSRRAFELLASSLKLAGRKLRTLKSGFGPLWRAPEPRAALSEPGLLLHRNRPRGGPVVG